MRKKIVITSIEQLSMGMKVEFRHSCLANSRKAVVSDIEYEQKCRYVDGKPVRALTVKSVNLMCSEDKILTVRHSNFHDFNIWKR